MRDFRDAKAMAHALRDCLKSRAADISHSECLELIAKEFGFDNWNILAAKIDAAQMRDASESPPDDTLYCSFCGKSQHDVKKLIAGPGVCICDECVELCTDIIREDAPFWKVLILLRAAEDSGGDPERRRWTMYAASRPRSWFPMWGSAGAAQSRCGSS
jgi:hypothetical protein